MNQLEALTTLLDATVEMDDRVHVRRARKVVARMAEKRRIKAEERAMRKAALPPGSADSQWPAVVPAYYSPVQFQADFPEQN